MNFAYLNLQDHPRGNVILQHLIKNKFIPLAIIEENSPLAIKNKNSVTSVFKNSSEKFPLTQDLALANNIPVFQVENHNDERCENLLRELKLDLIVLGDTRIIKKNIMNIPKIGIVNSHPGYLPDVRGNNPYIWAIVNDLPQGCSVHFIDENVDTGDLLSRELIDIKTCISYPDLLSRINNLCAKLMLDVLQKISNKTYTAQPQSTIKFIKENHVDREFFAASSEIKKAAIYKIEKELLSTLNPQ